MFKNIFTIVLVLVLAAFTNCFFSTGFGGINRGFGGIHGINRGFGGLGGFGGINRGFGSSFHRGGFGNSIHRRLY